MKKTYQFIEKARKVHGNIYDYSEVRYTTIDEKVEIICPKHGSFLQTPRIHLYKKGGCNDCAVERSKRVNTKTTEQFITDAIKQHGTKYDYSRVKYVNATTPVEIICPKHGSFLQVPSSHTRGYGCKKCAVREDNDWFLARAKYVHGDKYQYPDLQYVTGKSKITIQCSDHGHFKQTGESHLAGAGCPVCGVESRSFSSNAEIAISATIKNMGFTVVNGDRTIIFPKELDIYIPEKNIAIEYNGIFWHSELGGKDKYYHLRKTQECEKRDIELIHVFETEWASSPDLVLSRIKAKLGVNDRIFARKCSIVNIDSKTARNFFDTNHIQGSCNASINIALVYDGRIVAAMSFGKSRFNKQAEWELLRYCSEQGVNVIGGASRLFNHIIKTITPKSVISYSDKRWNAGTLYSQLGFKYSHDSRPNYFYFAKRDPLNLLSRQHFQKHKLKNILDEFDPDLTEWENMQNNGYNRIWDCGNSVWMWTPD